MTTLRHAPIASFVERLQRRYGMTTLVETGTFEGESTLWAAQRFRRVVTIDISLEFQDAALAACAEHSNVEFLRGDTRLVLPGVMASLDGPAVFWLDAHSAPGLFGKADDWPALEELEIIDLSPFAHFVLIDDAHCFMPGTPHPACPTFDQVRARAKEGAYVCKIHHDVIALVPTSVESELFYFETA